MASPGHARLRARGPGRRGRRAATGEPAWTDGQTIYVDAGAPGALKSLAVQASMIAAGSLRPDVVAGCCGTASWPSAT
ncbi:hypothetical protein I549_5312 [Mycobacterium avium subsp. avium 2285 (R)]|nr:hypothetical protein I549_5312 [Mycobacterium avium subsp. avium 2285 (R)]